ncbi:SigE family RNA polymerase sigma factor [Kitasatospora nipponensis]
MTEPEGFEEYVAARQGALLRTAYLLTGDAHLAQDLVQSTLLRVWQRWSRIGPMEHADGYVHRVMVTMLAGWRRRRWQGEVPHGDPALVPAPGSGAAHDPHAAHGDRAVLVTALRTLPPRQRAVVVLRFHLDLSEAQAAAALGCSVGTVKSQTAKALARLRGSVPVLLDEPADQPADEPADQPRAPQIGRSGQSGQSPEEAR